MLIAHGYHETITFSFCRPDQARLFVERGQTLVSVDEEKKRSESALRPSLLPSLLHCRKINQDAGNEQVQLFEIAGTFSADDNGYIEHRRLGLLADAPKAAESLRRVRGTLEELAEKLGTNLEVKPAREAAAWCEQPAEVYLDGKFAGTYGLASGAILKRFDLQTPLVLAEIDYPSLIGRFPAEPLLRDLPRYPAIDRDLSLIVAESVTWDAIREVIEADDPALLESVEYVTVYRGKPIAKGRKSVTLRMRFRDPQRTLKHEEVTEQVQGVVKALGDSLDAELRD